MVSFHSFVTFVALSLSTFTSAVPTNLYRRQCQATLDTAHVLAERMQSHDFNVATGKYSSTLWTDANALEDIHNLMLATDSDEWDWLSDESYLGRITITHVPWECILNGSYDDAQWVILAMYKIVDYRNARGKDASDYLASASFIYDLVASQWDEETCGGGVWWSKDKTYKNAITNQLFLLTSAVGYTKTNDQKYLDNAKKTWAWLSKSGMRNVDGLYNDGLDSSTCKNNGQTTWTYNQGVIASGLSALYHITGDESLLDEAEVTLDATIKHMTTNNILRESCDDIAKGGPSCNADQQIFKGIWMKHLQYYLDNADSAKRTAKYKDFMGAQSSAVYHYGIDGSHDVSNTWYAANEGGGVFTSQGQASGLAAIIAAAKYGPC